MKKIIISMFLALVFSVSAGAANVTVDGEMFDGAKLIGSVTYVPVRSFSERMAYSTVSWEEVSRTAKISFLGKEALARIGDSYIECMGRYIYSGNENKIIDGSTYVPLRSIAEIFGAEVEWDEKNRIAVVNNVGEEFESADEFYNMTDLYWLSKIISAESAGEDIRGKIAVGNVVLNRVRHAEYPNSIYEVIFDNKNGVQFTPVANGTIDNPPTEESVMAAKICLEDYKLSDKEILFFLNPQISTSTWVPDNRDYVMTIGRHDFYA